MLLVLDHNKLNELLDQWSVTDDFGYTVFHSQDDLNCFVSDLIYSLKEVTDGQV
jgi:hypothetical protein